MDRVLRHAIEQGLDPMTAIQMMTINTADHFGLSREMGMIAPGRWADVVLAKDLKDFKADLVIAKGWVIAEKGKWKVSLPRFSYPSWVTNSVHLKKKLEASDFVLRAPKKSNGRVKANVIGVIENQAPTKHLTFDLQPVNGEIKLDMKHDIAKIAIVKRHNGTNGITVGLVSGFDFKQLTGNQAHECDGGCGANADPDRRRSHALPEHHVPHGAPTAPNGHADS